MMIDIDNRQQKKDLTDEIVQLFNNVVDFSLKHMNFNYDYEICIVVTDNIGIQELNAEFRNINQETDVLSFPMHDFSNEPFSENHSFEGDINPETNRVIVGDIVLSLEKAAAQAIEYGHSYSREISFLLVHSVLHLLGYDHIEENDRLLMRAKEEEILNLLKITR